MPIFCRFVPRRQIATISPGRGDIYTFDSNRYTEYLSFKRQSEVVPDHRGKFHPLFVFIVRVHSGFVDQCLELSTARWPASEHCLGSPRQRRS
jgi:hypothetical protein